MEACISIVSGAYKRRPESSKQTYSHTVVANSCSISFDQVTMRSWSYALLGLLLLSAVLSPALGQWNLIADIRKHVTVSVNYVWAVNNINQVFRCVQPCNGAWIGVPGGLRKQIDAGDE